MRLLQYDGTGITHPEAYLFRVVRNLAIDLQRDPFSRVDFMPLDEEPPCTLPQPEEQAFLRQQCENLLDAIFSMPAS